MPSIPRPVSIGIPKNHSVAHGALRPQLIRLAQSERFHRAVGGGDRCDRSRYASGQLCARERALLAGTAHESQTPIQELHLTGAACSLFEVERLTGGPRRVMWKRRHVMRCYLAATIVLGLLLASIGTLSAQSPEPQKEVDRNLKEQSPPEVLCERTKFGDNLHLRRSGIHH